MATPGKKQQFFATVLPHVKWHLVGIDAMVAMSERVEEVVLELTTFLVLDATFGVICDGKLHYDKQPSEPPRNWRASNESNNASNQNALSMNTSFVLMAMLQKAFDEKKVSDENLQCLIDRPALGSYLLTNFFLNGANHMVSLDPDVMYTKLWKVISVRSGLTASTAMQGRGSLGTNNWIMANAEAFQSAPAVNGLQIAVMTLEDLGFGKFAMFQELTHRIKSLGAFLCPPHLIVNLLGECRASGTDECIGTLVMDPLARFGVPCVFGIYGPFDISDYTVNAIEMYPNTLVDPNMPVIFCLNDPYTKVETSELAATV